VSPPSRRSRKRPSGPSPGASAAAGRIRIIGGTFRGRRLAVADVAGLRPTGERVRETLFNWLQPHLPGARCLDLFAGSGALGIEALSRGAAHVTFVEPEARARTVLDAALATLDAGPRGRTVRGTADAFLASSDTPFDLVFVDPPFDLACQADVLAALAAAHLAPDARVYVEAPTRQPWPETLPDGLELSRERAFGEVTARLIRKFRRDAPVDSRTIGTGTRGVA